MKVDRIVSRLLVAGAIGASASCAPTPEPKPTETRQDLPTETPTLTPTPTSTPEPTHTPTASLVPTPTSAEYGLLGKYLSFTNSEGVQSEYPAWVNLAGNEENGLNITTVDKFVDYFKQRTAYIGALTGPADTLTIQDIDRMFGQLSRGVKDIADRDLNFDWRNGGQGLGFTESDFEVLRTFGQLKLDQEKSGDGIVSQITRRGEDGMFRAWTISETRDFEKTVLAYVDEFLRINRVSNPSTDVSVQAERRNLFENIIFGEFGVREIGERDELWQTVNDDFLVCETLTDEAEVRSEQPEVLEKVNFDQDLEVLDNKKEEETGEKRDSRNHILVVMVTDGQTLRVEVYDLSNPPDEINPGLDDYFAEKDPSRVFGGRWLPCGPGNIGPSSPGRMVTPPPPGLPTPVPTNEHRDEPNPENSDIPDRVPPSQIP